MLLPTKGIEPQRALLTVGAKLLSLLETPATVSGLWERYSQTLNEGDDSAKITFDWFAVALAMLFAIQAIDRTESGYLARAHVCA